MIMDGVITKKQMLAIVKGSKSKYEQILSDPKQTYTDSEVEQIVYGNWKTRNQTIGIRGLRPGNGYPAEMPDDDMVESYDNNFDLWRRLYMIQDITFCMSECDNEKCFRHASNISDKSTPHSFAYLKGTEVFCETSVRCENCKHYKVLKELDYKTKSWTYRNCCIVMAIENVADAFVIPVEANDICELFIKRED